MSCDPPNGYHKSKSPILPFFVFLVISKHVTGFVASVSSRKELPPLLLKSPPPEKSTQLFTFYNDFGEDDFLGNAQDDSETSNSVDDNDSSSFYAALRKRQSSLDQSRQRNMQAWKQAPVETSVFPLLNDWVRRVAMDTTAVGVTATSSYAIVGGASGSLYLIDLSAEAKNPLEVEENMMLGTLRGIHEDRGAEDFPDDDTVTKNKESARNRALEALYGGFDGGGIMALALQDHVVASSGREGGVHISRITQNKKGNNKNLLKVVGRIPDLEGDIVTSLVFDQMGRLWTGFYNQQGGGSIHVYNLDVDDTDDIAAGVQLTNADPVSTIKASSGILSLFLADDIGCGVASSEDNGIILFNMEGMLLDGWHPFLNDGNDDENGSDELSEKQEFARTAIIVQNDEASRDGTKGSSWSVVVAGSKGTMFQRRLNLSGDGKSVSFGQPFADVGSKIPEKVARASLSETVKHQGPIVALASPGPGVLLSASQDGTIRIWDCSYRQHEDDENSEIGKDEEGKTLPSFLFALSGFKVWLGSMIVLKSNFNMLVTDGADNTVVALIFKKAEDLEQ